jgi:Protein of unknown function/Domain of unknown function (DUF1835)
MIHIVFQANDVNVLREAMELDPSLKGEVLQIEDEWAVGPIDNIYSSEGIGLRREWWRNVLGGGDYDGLTDSKSGPDDPARVAEVKQELENDPAQVIWIWAAQNNHDVSGYYWLISQLKDYQGRIFILYLNNLPFINSKGHIFYPQNLFEIPAKEFIKAKKLARPVTSSEFEVDPDEWTRLSLENKGVRILEGGKKLKQFDLDYYDKMLKSYVTPEWQKAGRIIHHFLSKANLTIGDAFLLWRLKGFVGAGEVDMQGDLRKMKDFELKSKTANLAATAIEEL